MSESNRVRGRAVPLALDEVRRGELEEIRRRRRAAGLDDASPTMESGRSTDLIGLSLSGGGLRSACFSLGIVQAFYRSGLWRHIDYLSTVSGGGYIGSLLSSLVVRLERPITRENCPLLPGPADGQQQPAEVQRLVYGGRYLLRAWELVNKYLVGLFFINVALFSGLVTMAALIALLWRSLDLPVVRERAALLGLSSDLTPPFWFFFFFGSCWLAAWIASYWRRGAEAPGKMARFFLFLTAGSLLVGMALLLGNGDVDMASFNHMARQKGWEPKSGLWASVAGLILGGLLPFLSPQRLIQSGLNPKHAWERYVFTVASLAALVGVPMLLVGFFGRENISGFNTHPYRPVVPGDIQDVDAFLHFVWPDRLHSLRAWPVLEPSTVDVDPRRRSVRTIVQQMFYHPPAKARGMIESSTGSTWSAGNDTREIDKTIEELKEKRQELVALLDQQDEDARIAGLAKWLESTRGKWSASPEGPDVRLFCRVMMLSEVQRKYRELWARHQGTDAWYTPSQRVALVARRVESTLVWCCGLGSAENDSRELFELQQVVHALRQELCNVFNAQVLPCQKAAPERAPSDPLWANSLHLQDALLALDVPPASGPTGLSAATTPASAEDAERDQRLAALLRRRRAVDVREWMPHEVVELNRLLIEENFPEVLRARSEIRRLVSIEHDQRARLGWLLTGLAVLLTVGLWVDINATSMHRFYRTRLAHAFIVPRKDGADSPALSELNTTHYGSPYHLISASTGMVLDRNGNEGVPAGTSLTPAAPVRLGEPRRVDSFLFSHRYCGSQITGYAPTETYESYARGENNRIDLAEATALSGAALSPGQVGNWLIAFLMFALNLRLGQWVPNPARGRPRCYPTMLALLSNFLRSPRDRSYCFLTDGGNSDNLALVQLLRRRCRLIIAVDASCDPDYHFHDLARAIRTERIHSGIRLTALDDRDRDLDTTPLKPTSGPDDEGAGYSQRHFIIGRIAYPDAEDGILVLLKPNCTGDEGTDVLEYRSRYKEFPHDPTADQVFEVEQVESYRRLGDHVGMALCRILPQVTKGSDLWELPEPLTTEGLVDVFEAAGSELEPAADDAAGGKDTVEEGEVTEAVVDVEAEGRSSGDALDSWHPEPLSRLSTVFASPGNGSASASTALNSVKAPTEGVLDDLEPGAREPLRRLRETLVDDTADNLVGEPGELLPMLLRLLRIDGRARVRSAAVDTLALLAPNDSDVRDALRQAAESDPDRRVRRRARSELKRRRFPK